MMAHLYRYLDPLSPHQLNKCGPTLTNFLDPRMCAYTQSGQSLSFTPELETLDAWLPILCPLNTLIRLSKCRG